MNLWTRVYNMHQHIKNDTDSTDVVENQEQHTQQDC
jgi:hypothetical protein